MQIFSDPVYFRLDRFGVVMSTRTLMDLALSSFKLEGKDAWFEDKEHFVLMTDYTEDLTVLFWGQPSIHLTLRVPEEGTNELYPPI